jgi:hypothetical protein
MRTVFAAVILFWTTSTIQSDALPGSKLNQLSEGLLAMNPNRQKIEDETLNDKNIVEVINSGSTNTAGFKIKIQRNGSASWSYTGPLRGRHFAQAGATGGEQQLPADLTSRFFTEIESALPFSQYPDSGGGKSRSFGYSVRIHYCGTWSPDLSNPPGMPPKDPKLACIHEDMQKIFMALKVGSQIPRSASY